MKADLLKKPLPSLLVCTIIYKYVIYLQENNLLCSQIFDILYSGMSPPGDAEFCFQLVHMYLKPVSTNAVIILVTTIACVICLFLFFFLSAAGNVCIANIFVHSLSNN